MESDIVQSVGETQEALDVANIIKGCYYDIIGHLEPPESWGLFGLDASTDDTKPVLMTLPERVVTYDWIKYDQSDLGDPPSWSELDRLEILDFLSRQTGMDQDDQHVHTMVVIIDGKEVSLRYRDDRQPNYYMLIGDRTFIFDSYDADTSVTVEEARTLGYGLLAPEFLIQDTFVPDLDPRQFQLLLEHSKTVCFQELKQIQNPKAEQIARRQWVKAQKDKFDTAANGTSQQRRYSFGRNSACSPLTRSKRIFGSWGIIP